MREREREREKEWSERVIQLFYYLLSLDLPLTSGKGRESDVQDSRVASRQISTEPRTRKSSASYPNIPCHLSPSG